jgi:hypothetical protein
MHVLITASCTVVRSMRIWMHAQYAVHCGIRSGEMRQDDPSDVEGEHPKKRVPAKVIWYAPIIPHLKHLFRNKEHVKLMRWHKEDRKVDAMSRHPACGRTTQIMLAHMHL